MLIICDMDGVLYRGTSPIAVAAEAIHALQAAGHCVCFATNNGYTPIAQIVERLVGMGITTDARHLVGASWMAAELIRRDHPSVRLPYVIGGSELRRQLRRVGLRPVPALQPEFADALVVGLDLAFSYKRLARAQSVGLRGVPFVVTDADAAYPWHTGLLPGTGAMLVAVETACGRRADLAGKPAPHMYAELIRRMAWTGGVVVVGDHLDIDVVAGKRLGVPTILTLTGIATQDDVAARPPEARPDYVVQSIAHLPEVLQQLPDASHVSASGQLTK